ncbi:MAG: hypothetical protein ACYC44_02245 [Patescibacteria group bacterium]
MAQEETNAPSNANQPSDASAKLVQQGYQQALGDLPNLITNYQFSNEANRPTTVEAFKNNLFKLDRGVVKKMFDTARDLRNKPDLSFTINELPNVSIPKKIFTDELKTSGKKFLTDYDQKNYQNLQVKSQAEASAKSEGSASKLDAAKSAVLGTGFGAVGSALGGMVGLKPVSRKTPAKKTPVETKAAEKATLEPVPETVETPVPPTTRRAVRNAKPAPTPPATAKVTTSVTTTLRGVGPSAAPAQTAGGTLRGVGPAPTTQATPSSDGVRVGGEVKTEAQATPPTQPSAPAGAEATPQATPDQAQAATPGLAGTMQTQAESTTQARADVLPPPPAVLPTAVPTGVELAPRTRAAGPVPSAPLNRQRPRAAAMQMATGISSATPPASVTRRIQRAGRRPTTATIVAPATSSITEVGTSEVPVEDIFAEETPRTPETATIEPPTLGNIPGATPITPVMPGLAARRPTGQAQRITPTTRRAPRAAKGYRRVGPQEIKPPIGRSLEMGRAMGLQAAKDEAGQVLLENLPPEELTALQEGLALSGGGLESELGEGAGGEPSLPVQFGQFYNPLERRRPAIFAPQYLGPGSMAMEPEELETEETEGGTPQGEIEQLQSFQAEQQKANLAAEQLTGAPTVPSALGSTRAGAAVSGGAARRGPTQGAGQAGGQGEASQILSRAVQLRGQQMQAASAQQSQMQQIESLKASIESIKRAKQAFKNLIDTGEIAGSESGVTLLTLWGEWNIDLINKHIANGKIPYFEQKPSEGALQLEKTISNVKDGITIFADIVVPISILASMILPLIFVAIIVLSSFKVIMAISNFFGITLI